MLQYSGARAAAEAYSLSQNMEQRRSLDLLAEISGALVSQQYFQAQSSPTETLGIEPSNLYF